MNIKSVLSGYAQIYFSKDWYVGLLFLIATFIIPAQGLAGLMGLLLADFFARMLHLPSELIDEGYFAYNGMLVGLALALTYRVDWAFAVIFIGAIALTVPIAATLHSLMLRYLGTPPLSAPFVLASWLALTAGRRFPGLLYTVAPYEVETLVGVLPQSFEYCFRTLAAAFFQFNIPAGILIFLGLMLFSRHALMLSIIGIAAGASVQALLGRGFYHLDGGWLGFNYALTAIAIGGTWVVPGFDSTVLAAIGGLLCALITAASLTVLEPLGLPVLAFPFVATTTLVLYTLRNRIVEEPFRVLASPADRPEENVKRASHIKNRGLTTELPAFYLPVRGSWVVTQGVNGDVTHKGMWSHAWDFEVINGDGSTYKGMGRRLEDFHCYHLPVFAPAAGKVVNVVNDVPDNEVGQVNNTDNWGNVVVISHRGGYFTLLAHLAADTISVSVGDDVQAGTTIGRVGSSGRSPAPHLHFQVQLSSKIGAPTVAAQFVHYERVDDEKALYVTRGIPKENETIRLLVPERKRALAAAFPLGLSWTYEVQMGEKSWVEKWRSAIDFAGYRSLICEEKQCRLGLLLDKSSLITGPVECVDLSGLAWFSLAVPRVPFTNDNVTWQDCLPPDLLLSRARGLLFDFLEPFVSLAEVRTKSRFLPSAPFAIETTLEPAGLLMKSEEIKTVSHFQKGRGLTSMVVTRNEKTICSLQLKEITGEKS